MDKNKHYIKSLLTHKDRQKLNAILDIPNSTIRAVLNQKRENIEIWEAAVDILSERYSLEIENNEKSNARNAKEIEKIKKMF